MTRIERPWVCLATVLVILAVALSMPAMAGHLSVASEHTTDTDFQNANTLNNLDIVGSGTSAELQLRPDTATDSVSRASDEQQISTRTDKIGLIITTNQHPVKSLSGDVSSQTGGLDSNPTAYILDSNGNTLASTSVSAGSFSFNYELDANTKYYVVLDDGGDGWDPGAEFNGGTVTSTGLDIEGSYDDFDGSEDTGEYHAVNNLDYEYVEDTNNARYTSATHDAEDVEEGYVNLNLDSTTADITWEAHDGSQWVTVGTTTTSSSGEATTSLSGDYDQWRVDVQFSPTGTGTADLTSEGVRYTGSDPSFDNSTASPSGGELETGDPIELSIDLSDPDFGTAQGDEVTVEWYINGSKVDTTTHTTNGTASVALDDPPTGDANWHAEATDAGGHTATSDTFQFETPDELAIYEETDPDTLVTGTDLNVTVRFYQEDEDNVIERTTDDGTVSMTGLPIDEEFIVTIDANGYEFRRVIVDSLLEQQDVFLLNSTEQSATVIFELDDQTGRFPSSDTKLYVERALNQSGNTRYRVIAGDRFGASGEFPVALQDNDRYRLRIENDEGETRVLGAYTTSGDDRAILPIGRVELAGELGEDLVVQAELRRVPDSADVSHEFEARVFVLDEAEETSEFTVRIINESGGVVRAESTEVGPWGRYVETFPLDNYTEGDTYYVQVNATRNGETREFREPIGDLPTLPTNWPIDPWVLQLIGYVSIVALMGFMTIASPTLAAIVGVAYAALLTGLGIVPIPGLGLGVAGSIAILYRLGGDR